SARGVRRADHASVQLRQRLDDREPDAAAAFGTRPGVVGAHEALEDANFLTGRYAGTRVPHLDRHRAPGLAYPQRYAASRRRVSERVVEQVADDLEQAFLVRS